MLRPVRTGEHMEQRKKSARPVGGTTERARQEKQQTRGNSRQNHTTPGRRGQWKISDLLSCGRENAISCRELERLTGLDGRTVRLMIERERRKGAPILADNTTGYYLPPATEHERTACVRSMRHRAAEIMRTAEAIEGAEV